MVHIHERLAEKHTFDPRNFILYTNFTYLRGVQAKLCDGSIVYLPQSPSELMAIKHIQIVGYTKPVFKWNFQFAVSAVQCIYKRCRP
jgi:hypothetical protein